MHDVSRPSRLNGAVVVVGVLVSAVLLSGCDWYGYRGNAAHTGESAGEKVIGVGNVATLGERWTTSEGDPVDNVIGRDPVVAGGRLYADEANGILAAYDARGVDNCAGSPKECQPVWKAHTGGGTPAVVGGVVYDAVGGALSAYDAAGSTGCSGTPPTCQPVWTASVGDHAAAPEVTGGIVYVTGVVFPDVVLFAFDAAGQQGCTGTPKVCAPLWTAIVEEDGNDNAAGGSSPAVANGRVFVPGGDNTVYVFDAAGQHNCGGTPKSCSALWTATVPLPCSSNSSPCDISVPAVANGVLYVTADAHDSVTSEPAGGLYAFDAAGTTSCGGSPKKCSPLWRSTSPTLFAPAVANGVVYTVSYAHGEGHRLRAYDAAGVEGCTGVPKICAPLWTSTTDLVPVGNEGLTPTDGLTSAPAVANGVAYVVGIDHMICGTFCTVIPHLFAFDGSGAQGCAGIPKQCAPLFDKAGAQDIKTFSEPVVANGTLYVDDAGFDGHDPQVTVVHAFTP
jgi:PQQ-like domain